MNFVTVSDKKQKQKQKEKLTARINKTRLNNKSTNSKSVPASVSDCHPNSHTFTKYFSLS